MFEIQGHMWCHFFFLYEAFPGIFRVDLGVSDICESFNKLRRRDKSVQGEESG